MKKKLEYYAISPMDLVNAFSQLGIYDMQKVESIEVFHINSSKFLIIAEVTE